MFTQKFKTSPAQCHPDKAIYAKGKCRSCYEKQLRKRNPEFAKRQRENCQAWCQTHKTQKKKTDALWRAKQDPEYRRAKYLMGYYGITPAEYEHMLISQNGCCAICKRKPAKGKRLAIDHDHITGKIRGLLCFRCNFGLSFFSENPLFFARASKYLTTNK